MADKKTEQGAENAATAVTPIRYSIARLRQDCRKLFGITTSTFDGAVYGIKEKKFTVEEMAAQIKKWQVQPVVPAKKKEEN